MAIANANEYTYATATRRLLFRQAEGGGNTKPEEAAAKVAQQMVSILGATEEPKIANPRVAAGIKVATVTATVGLAPNQRFMQVAIFRFADGRMIELTLDAAPDDKKAVAEFKRLLKSVKPAPTDVNPFARTLAAGPRGQEQHPVGFVFVDLTPEYHVAGPLVVTEGGASFAVEMVAPRVEAGGTLLGRFLSGRVEAFVGRDGQPVTTETGPYRLPGEGGVAMATERPARPDEDDSVRGAVQGTQVTIRVTTGSEGGSAKELGRTLLRVLGGKLEN